MNSRRWVLLVVLCLYTVEDNSVVPLTKHTKSKGNVVVQKGSKMGPNKIDFCYVSAHNR